MAPVAFIFYFRSGAVLGQNIGGWPLPFPSPHSPFSSLPIPSLFTFLSSPVLPLEVGPLKYSEGVWV